MGYFKSIEQDHSFNIQESNINSNAYNVKAFAFSNGNYYCAPIESISIDWSDAYYSRMSLWYFIFFSLYGNGKCIRKSNITTIKYYYFLYF